jgi:RNA polymerase sigma-70 factor (ECF subfamily)
MLSLEETLLGGECRSKRGSGGIIPAAEEARVPEEPFPDFAQVYEAYHGKVVSYASKLLGRDDAEDVSQEVFVKIDRSLGTLSDPSKLTSWIYAITLNTVRDAARKRAAAPERASADADLARADDEGEAPIARIRDTSSRTPEEDAMHNEMVACYLDYVRQLPANYYEVYVLSEFEHLSNEDIARRLSVSVGAVKIRLHRARTQLNEELRRNCRCYHNARGEVMGEPKGR